MFEFVVKINGKLFLRSKSRASTVKTAKFNNSLLINNKFNQYWISWIDGMIEIGSGWMVGEEKLLSYKDLLNVNINYFAVRAMDGITISYDVPEGEVLLKVK